MVLVRCCFSEWQFCLPAFVTPVLSSHPHSKTPDLGYLISLSPQLHMSYLVLLVNITPPIRSVFISQFTMSYSNESWVLSNIHSNFCNQSSHIVSTIVLPQTFFVLCQTESPSSFLFFFLLHVNNDISSSR